MLKANPITMPCINLSKEIIKENKISFQVGANLFMNNRRKRKKKEEQSSSLDAELIFEE